MTCPKRDVRLYCTAGNGMEPFLVEEVKTKLAAKDVDHIPGKVFFTTSVGIKQVTELKSAERLFLLLKQDSPFTAHSSTAKTASLIQARLVGDSSDWTGALSSWKRLQAELKMKSGRAESVTVLGRKRKREDEEGSGVEESISDRQNGPQRQRGLEGDTKELSKGHMMSSTGDTENGKCLGMDLVKGDRVEGDPDGDPGSKAKERSSVPQASHDDVSFRVNCKCSGALAKRFTPQDLSRIIGTAVSRLLGWRVDLRKPDLEVNVYLSDDHCVLGIPLLRLPLASRSYMKTTGLRSTIAWAMASLSDIQPGSRVIDPMCGVGTILLEAAQECQDAFFLGMDIDESQLLKACQNVEFADLRARVQLLQASSIEIPLPSCSVDAVVCDVPFGKKFGSKTDMAASLPVMVREMERVLRTGGTLVLLLSPQLSSVLKRSLSPGPAPSHTQGEETLGGLGSSVAPSPTVTPGLLSSLQPQARHRVSLGAIDALIHKFVKTQTVTVPHR